MFCIGSIIYMLVDVNIILITSSNPMEIEVSLLFRIKISFKDLKCLNYLGIIKVKRTTLRVLLFFLGESIYNRTPIKSSYKECQSHFHLIINRIRLHIHYGDSMSNTMLYKSIAGELQYATIITPKIAYSVNKVYQFMQHSLGCH